MAPKNILKGRKSYSFDVSIASGAALSNVISFREFGYGIVHMPAAWTAANIGFQVSSTLDGTFLPLYDDAGALVEIASPAVDQAMRIPVEVMAARFVRLWSQTGGSGTNQAAARALIIDMKS
jgi:hypothetical protein